MLQLKLSVEQAVQDPNLLYVKDVTPAYDVILSPGGYGLPNLTRAQLTHVIFRLITPGGRSYHTDPFVWPSGTYSLRSSMFHTDDLNIPLFDRTCTGLDRQTLTEIQDGQYDIVYEVYAKQGIPTQTANYNLKVDLQVGDQVWMKKNNVWVDVTAQGSRNADGYWVFTKLDTTDRYTSYEVRKYATLGGYHTCLSGLVNTLIGPSPSQPTNSSTTAQLVAATSGRILFLQRVTRALAIASKALLLACRPMPNYSTVRADGMDSLLALYTAKELLSDLRLSGSTDSKGVGEQLTDIKQKVNYLSAQASNNLNSALITY